MQKALFIKTTEGIHARIAVELVQAASRYAVDFNLHYKDKVIDLKSILGLMSLAIPQGEDITIVATGRNAEIALGEIYNIFTKQGQ